MKVRGPNVDAHGSSNNTCLAVCEVCDDDNSPLSVKIGSILSRCQAKSLGLCYYNVGVQ